MMNLTRVALTNVGRTFIPIFAVPLVLRPAPQRLRHRRPDAQGRPEDLRRSEGHFDDRRAEPSYVLAPEDSLGLNLWLKDLSRSIARYAKGVNVPFAPASK